MKRWGFMRVLAGCVAAGFVGTGVSGCDDSDDDPALDAAKADAVAQVHAAAVALGDGLAHRSSEGDRIRYIRSFIDPVRFYEDGSGYFYVYDMNCVNIAHATQKDLVGRNLYDYTDSREKFVIRELAAAAQDGGGFVEYYWIKPGETGEKLKIGYVEPIPGSNYFIGSGVYIE